MRRTCNCVLRVAEFAKTQKKRAAEVARIQLHAFSTLVFILVSSLPAFAQQPPSIGYMFPPGGQAGKTIEVTLGGYDWTPDMQVFVHDPPIKLEVLSPPGPVIVPEPPYWFGKKARRGPFPLPREARARLTIPTDTPLGVYKWQAANANGATATGRLIVGDIAEAIEIDERIEPQLLSSLPLTISGQIKKIQEVDRYQFTSPHSGPITCEIDARAIGSDLNAVLEVYDDAGRMVANAADTSGNDTAVTFVAKANKNYSASVYDVDFRGNRAFVYRLTVTAGPRVIASIPACGKRGETRTVELVGYGVATGAAELESVTREITFPTDPRQPMFHYRLQTSHGTAPPFALMLSDFPQTNEAVDESANAAQLTIPVELTGVVEERYGEDRYRIEGKKDAIWAIRVEAERVGSPLDVTLAVFDAEGKELASSDDSPDSTDAGLEFVVPADGGYQIAVGDVAGASGNRTATYRLLIGNAKPGFEVSAPELVNVPIGGKVVLAIKVIRFAKFADPITVSLTGLPSGVSVPENLTIPAGKTALNIDLSAAGDAAATATLCKVIGEAILSDAKLRSESASLLVATTIKPPFSIDAEGKDDVTKWPRGTTFPAPVLIERDEGFEKEIVLEMASKQGRHRQGITGPELLVESGVLRILYPVFLPEWLETTRTSRMVVNGSAKVSDPQGNIRYSLVRQKTRMGFLPTGALLKLAADVKEIRVTPGQQFSVPLTVSRSSKLMEPVRLELVINSSATSFTAEPITLGADQDQIDFPILMNGASDSANELNIDIRATVMQDGHLPVVSTATIELQFDQAEADSHQLE